MATYSAMIITPNGTRLIQASHVALVLACRAAWVPNTTVTLAWENGIVVYGILRDGTEVTELPAFKSAITRLGKHVPPPNHCLECDGSGYHTDDCPNKSSRG